MKELAFAIIIVSARCMQGATALNLCTNEQTNCRQALRHASVCQNAELHCKNWQDKIQQYFLPLPPLVRRESPWSANCSAEEFYCPLTFQCLSKTDNCSFSSHYTGGGQGNSVTPWGYNCSLDEVYCPLYASCVPTSQPCSLNALSTYLSNNSIGYFGRTCSNDEKFCPGTQSCISGTIPCTYNESLAIFNITCLQDRYYCIDERACTNQTCTSPVRHTFAFNDTETGWHEFCDNFQYICPKILSIQFNCEQVIESNPDCLSLCGPSPETNCYCPNDTFNAYCKSPTVSSNIASDFYSSTPVSLYNESSASPHYPIISTLKMLEGNLSSDSVIEFLTVTFPVTATEITAVRNTLPQTNTEEKAVLSPHSIEPTSKVTSHANSFSLLSIEDSMVYKSTSLHTAIAKGASAGELLSSYTTIDSLALSVLPSYRASLSTTTAIAALSLASAIKESLTYVSTSVASIMSEVASIGESLSVYTSVEAVTPLPSPSYRASSKTAATIIDQSLSPTIIESLKYMSTSAGSTMLGAASIGESLSVHTNTDAVTPLPSPSYRASSKTAATIIDQSLAPTIIESLKYMSTSAGSTMLGAASIGESLSVHTNTDAVTPLPSPSYRASSKTAATIIDQSLAPTIIESLKYMSTSAGSTMLGAASIGESLSVHTNTDAVTPLPSPSYRASSKTAATIIDQSQLSTLVKSTSYLPTMPYPQTSEVIEEIESLLDHSTREPATLPVSSLYERSSFSTNFTEQSTAYTKEELASYFWTLSSQEISDFTPTVESSLDFSKMESVISPSSDVFLILTTSANLSQTNEESKHQMPSSLFPSVPEPATGGESISDYSTDGPKTPFLSHSPGIPSKSIVPINSSLVYSDSIIDSFKDLKSYVSTSSNPEVSEFALSLESSSDYHRIVLQSSFSSMQYTSTSLSATLPIPFSMESIQESESHVSSSLYPMISEVSSSVKSSSMYTDSTTSYLSPYETSFTTSAPPSTYSSNELTTRMSSSFYPPISEARSVAELSLDLKSEEPVTSSVSLLSEPSSKLTTLTNPSLVEHTEQLSNFISASSYSAFSEPATIEESMSLYTSKDSLLLFSTPSYEIFSSSAIALDPSSVETIKESINHNPSSSYPTIPESTAQGQSSLDPKSVESMSVLSSPSYESSSASTSLSDLPSTIKQSTHYFSTSSYSAFSEPSGIEESMSPYISKESSLDPNSVESISVLSSPSYESSSTSTSLSDLPSTIKQSTHYFSTSSYSAFSEPSGIEESMSPYISKESSLDPNSVESISVLSSPSYESSSTSTSLSDLPSTIKQSTHYFSTSSYSAFSEPSGIEESMSPYTTIESLLSFSSPSYETSSTSNGILELSSVEAIKKATSYISSMSDSTYSGSIVQGQSSLDSKSEQSIILLPSSSYETPFSSTSLPDPQSMYASKESTYLRASNVASNAASSKEISSSHMVGHPTSTLSLVSYSSSLQSGSFARTSPVSPFEASFSPFSASLYSEISDFTVGVTTSEISQVFASPALSSPLAPSQTTTQATNLKDSRSNFISSTEIGTFTLVPNVSTSVVVNQASTVPPTPTTITLMPGTTQPPAPVCLVICQLQLSDISTKSLAESYPKVMHTLKIAIVHFSFTSSASLRAHYNGSWHRVVNATVESALVLGSVEKVRVDTSLMVSGEFLVQIANVSSTLASGSRINVTGQRLCQLSILYIPSFNVQRLTFSGHHDDQKMVLFKDRIYVNQLFNVSRLTLNFQSDLQAQTHFPNSTCVKDYLARVQYVKKCIPRIPVTFEGNTNLLPVDTGNIDFTFMKSANVSFGLVYVCGNETFRNGQDLLHRQIQKKDCKSSIINAPYIPYRSSSVEYFIREINGFQAEDQGIAIVHSQTEYGSFEWRTGSNGTWQEIKFSAQDHNNSISVKWILLKPNDKIRFTLNGTKLEWDATAALNKASIKFHKWNIADNRKNGVHYETSGNNEMKCETNHLSFCCYSQFLIQIPLGGCDKKPGSTLKNNTCGECKIVENQIYRKCNDCSAVIDGCSKCALGSTGKAFNYLKDCLGLCDKAVNDSCGNCLLKTAIRNFTDCNGVCNGKAFINSCGYCVNGTTGQPSNRGMDDCGVCNGNGSSCQDCSGNPNGNKVRDHCGNCLLKNHPSFNNCTKYIDVPLCWAIERELEVKVVGVQGYRGSNCSFVLSSIQHRLSSQFVNDTEGVSTFKISTSSINANSYYLKCNFTSDLNHIAIKTVGTIRMYSNVSTNIASSSPLEAPANFAFDLTIDGSDFPNCSNVKCMTHNGLTFEATMDNASRVRCHVPKLPPGFLKVSLAFSTRRVFDEGNHATVSLFLTAANVTSAKFQSGLNKISIAFDADSYTPNSSCSAFLKNISTLGNSPNCLLTSPRQLTVYLGRSASIIPGDTLTFVLTSINRNALTKYLAQEQSVVVLSPVKSIIPKVVLRAASTVGSCADIYLSGSDSYGSAGRPLKYYWNASVAPSYQLSLTHAQQSAFDDLKQNLSFAINQHTVILQANGILVGIPIKFDLCIENFLNQRGCATKTVTRVSSNVPVIDVGHDQRTQLIAKEIVINANAYFQAKCLQASKGFWYKWSCSGGIVLNTNNISTLYILPGTFEGGQNYKIDLTVTPTSDATASAKASITLLAVAPPLNIFLNVPPSISVMEQLDFTPEDPDNPGATLLGTCFVSFQDDQSQSVTTYDGRSHRSLVLKGCSRFQIPVKNYFTSGKCYKSKLDYEYQGQTAIFERGFCVSNPEVPVTFITPPTQRERFDVSSQLVLKATIYYSKKVVDVVWRCDAPSQCALSKSGNERNKVTKLINRNCIKGCLVVLIVAEGMLPWDTKLNFSVTVSSHEGASLIRHKPASIIITTNGLPRGGLFTVNPLEGEALVTKFQLAASNWLDKEDHLPLQYRFGYIDPEKGEVQIKFSLSASAEVVLPPGDASNNNKTVMFVDVIDQYGAKEREIIEIVVKPRYINEEMLKSQLSSPVENIASDPLSSGTTIRNVMLAHAQSKGRNKELAKAEIDLKKHICNELLQTVDFIEGQSGKESILQAVSGVLLLMTKSNTPNELALCAAKISFATAGGKLKQLKRRRRSTSTTIVDPISVTQAESHLHIFNNLDPSRNDPYIREAADYFLTTVARLMRGMCRSSIPLGPALVAKSNPAVLQAVTVDLASADYSEIQLGCKDCPSYISNASYLQSGTSLADLYSSYVCNPNHKNCTTVCLSSAQMPLDYLSSPVEPDRLSYVIYITLWNPDPVYSANELPVVGLSKPMIIKIPLTRLAHGFAYLCKRWDLSTKKWVDSDATALFQNITVVDSTPYINCSVNQAGYVAVFKGPKIQTTPVPSTTSTSSTVGRPRITVQFSFLVNCTTFISGGNKAKFEESVRQSIDKTLRQNNVKAINGQANCNNMSGITLTIDIVGVGENETLASVNKSVMLLKALVESDALVITVWDGRNITADPSSFAIISLSPTPSTKPTVTTSSIPPPEPRDKSLSAGAIAGIVIAVIFFIVVLACILYYCFFRKHTKRYPLVHPTESGFEMNRVGIVNENYNGYQGSP